MKTLTLLAIFTVAMQCQPAERVLPFKQLQTGIEMNEAATVIRSVGGIRDLSVQVTEKTLTVGGDPARIELAEWLMVRLDRTGATSSPVPPELDFRPAGASGEVFRVLYFHNAMTARDRSEMATAIRSLIEIPTLFVSQAAGAMVIRGSTAQADAARWMFEALDRKTPSAAGPYRLPGDGDETIRLFPMPAAGTLEEFYRFATEARTELQAKRFFTYTPHRVIAIRGSQDLIDRAATRFGKP